MKRWVERWSTDKLWGSLVIFWLATVFSSVFGSYLLPLELPGLGVMFAFRYFLQVTAALYLFYARREKESFWRGVPLIEKCCYVLIAILLVYGAMSLPRAIDFAFTFRKLFNLCFDLLFFFLFLRLMRRETLRRLTFRLCGAMLALFAVLGIYEVFCGGIWDNYYGDWKRFEWFTSLYQAPLLTFGNTNDLLLSLCFLLVAVLLWVGLGEKLSRTARRGMLLLFPALYLLICAAGAQLVQAGWCLALAGLFLYLLLADRRRLWVPLASLLLIGFIWFGNNYRYVVPPIQTYFQEIQAYREAQKQAQESPDAPPSAVPQEKPSLVIGNPQKESLKDQFIVQDEETGEAVLREDDSAGARAHLLLYAASCLRASNGLGMGLGNTEISLRDIGGIGEHHYWSLHCFIARLIADYGIFVLAPLCVIGFLLLKRCLELLLIGIRRRDGWAVGYALLYLTALATYPFLSTASSDAQDNLAMWIYLAVVVWVGDGLAEKQPLWQLHIKGAALVQREEAL